MSLRSEIESLLVEFEHFAYAGAPLDVAVEKLQEILARTAPRVLTTVEDLDSEEASKAVCLIPDSGVGIFGLYWRNSNGTNDWAIPGRDEFYSSAELIAEFSAGRTPAFTMVAAPDNVPAAPRRILTTEAELNSAEAFDWLCIAPYGGPIRTVSCSSNGVNYWQEPGFEGEYSSAELLAHFASIGAEARFTVIEG